MAAPASIKKLVEEFERFKARPVPDSFDEARLCTSYVEPFWEALGWKVRDPREAVKEKRVRLRAGTKHADYCFQLKSKPQFVVEAKDFRKRLAAAKSDAVKRGLRRAIAAAERKIDALVYELYGLTAEEIKIVEGSGS
jgi:hypothetical protein